MGWTLLTVAIVCAHYYHYDVQPERARLALTDPVLHHVFAAGNPEDNRTAVVDLAGLGNVDATDTARALPSLAQLGQVWAVQYDNAGLDTAVISRLITKRAHRAAVSRIVVVGHSMGGIIALEVADHIYQDTELELQAVILDCTPINMHAVRAQSRNAGEDMLRWMGWLPGARESRALRLLVETVARKDRFITPSAEGLPLVDLPNLYGVVNEVVREKLLSDTAASNGLIQSQFIAIVASGAHNNLEALTSRSTSKQLPAFVLLRPDMGTDDPIVNVDYTQRALFDQTGGPRGRLLVVRMAPTGHANPMQQPQAYNAAIATTVSPFLSRLDRRDNANSASRAAHLGSAPS